MIGVFVVGLIALVVFVVWIYDPPRFIESLSAPPEGAVTLTGEMVCLPKRETDGPQTLECAFGLYGTDGNYYALRDVSTERPPIFVDIAMGSVIEVTGTFAEQTDERYRSVGTITVDSVAIVGGEEEERVDTTSDGIITFAKPTDFGLAISEEQILVESTISPCEEGFLYCLYYLDSEYDNTNFESAGIGIYKPEEFATEEACLNTPPEGYVDRMPDAVQDGEGYAISGFFDLGDAATGQYTNGEEYRLYTQNTCYALAVRIGESQFENMESESVVRFTTQERAELMARMRGIVASFKLNESGDTLTLPGALPQQE